MDDLLITGINSEINKITYKIKKNFIITKCIKVNCLLWIKIEENYYNYIISQI